MMKLMLTAILAVTPMGNPEVRRPTHCPEYASVVTYVGFPIDQRREAHRIMHRESRCLPHVFNAKDPNGGSIGLFQINMFWCKPSRYFPEGWLQSQGILQDCNDLFNPLTNVRAAKAIYDYSADRNDYGWHPWLP
jgi:hypothetical protein